MVGERWASRVGDDVRSEAEKQAEKAWVEAEAAVRREQDEWLAEYRRTGETSYNVDHSETVARARRLKIAWLHAVQVARANGYR